MITSVFKKSTPFNYTLIILSLLIFFIVYQFKDNLDLKNGLEITITVCALGVFFASFFIINFIVKKNRLTKDSSYSLFFYLLLLLFFPAVFLDNKLILSNFFIFLALRRLISIQTQKAVKEKIFDASIWILIASIFHFWAILFLILVYSSILFHVSRDYKNWLIPLVAAFTVSILFVFFSLLIDKTFITTYLSSGIYSFKIDYFNNQFQNISFSIYVVFALYFLFTAITSLQSKPLNMQSSYKQIIMTFLVSIVIFIVSDNKSNELLLFSFFPLAVMATNDIEYSPVKIRNEIVLLIFILAGFFCYFSQL
jgi:hypothetical protein